MSVSEEVLYKDAVLKTLAGLSDEPTDLTLRKNLTLLCLDQVKNENLFKRALEELEGLGPLAELIQDEEISEIMVNGFDQIYFERQGLIQRHSRGFISAGTFYRTLCRIQTQMEKVADIRHPLVDGILSDGSRVHIALPPVTPKPFLTIRKHLCKEWGLCDFINSGMITPAQAGQIRGWVESKKNILVCGPTNSGKTTLLRAMLDLVPSSQRIITIEDTRELYLKGDQCVSLVAREDLSGLLPPISLTSLLKNSLRMRPDRLVVGEVRDGEALTLLDALATGHAGSMSSLHGSHPVGALSRLESLVSRAAPQWPLDNIRKLISQSIDVILILENRNGLRKLSQAVEIASVESFGYLFKPL